MTLDLLATAVLVLGLVSMLDAFRREPKRSTGTTCFGAATGCFVAAVYLGKMSALPGSHGLALDGFLIAVGCLFFMVAALYHGALER